jgi:hypothetical protein
VPSFATIVSTLNGPSWQGGHGKLRKVRIENCDWVPSYIEFVGKKLKTKDNYEAQCQLSMEALAHSIDHLGVIQFYAIHVETMEVYQLWWNEGKFWGMLKYHDSQNQSLNNWEPL